MDWLAGGIDHGGHYCRAIWQKPKVHATALSEIPLTRDCILSYTNLLQILGKIYSKFHLPLSLYYFLRVIGILLSNNFQKMYQRVLDKTCIPIKNILDNYTLINVINTYTFFFRTPRSFLFDSFPTCAESRWLFSSRRRRRRGRPSSSFKRRATQHTRIVSRATAPRVLHSSPIYRATVESHGFCELFICIPSLPRLLAHAFSPLSFLFPTANPISPWNLSD